MVNCHVNAEFQWCIAKETLNVPWCIVKETLNGHGALLRNAELAMVTWSREMQNSTSPRLTENELRLESQTYVVLRCIWCKALKGMRFWS